MTALSPAPCRPFDAVLVSTKCRVRIETLSARRPDALMISANAHIMARNGIVVAMPPMERKVFLLLGARRGAVVPYAVIEDALWGDDPDGGAEATRAAIGAVASRLRPAALLLGFQVAAYSGQGLYALDLFPSCQQVAA